MAVLTVQKIVKEGIAPSYVPADAAGDQFANNGRVYLHVKNGGAAAVTITIDSVRKCDQGFDHNITGSVAAGGEGKFGPFDPSRFNDSNGRVKVNYSAVTSVTVGAFEV